MQRRAARAYAIRRGMEVNGWKAPQLARLIGRDANTVRRWAENKTQPTADDWVELARVFGVKVGDLLTPPEIPEYPLDGAFREAALEVARSGRLQAQVERETRRRASRREPQG